MRPGHPAAEQPPRAGLSTRLPTSHSAAQAHFVHTTFFLAERPALAIEYQCVDELSAVGRICAKNLGFQLGLVHLYRRARLLHPA